MSVDWYPGIRAFCAHWAGAGMLNHTFETLDLTFDENHDACIDAAKSVVECACHVIIANLDDPNSPAKPSRATPTLPELLSAAVKVLDLGDVRDEAFKKLISQYYKLSETLSDLRNKAGTVSHGKDGFIEKLTFYHRRSAILAADAIVAFLHEAYSEIEPDPTLSREPYERFAASNALIDRFTALSVETDDEGVPTLLIQLPNGEEIPLVVDASLLLFTVDPEAYKYAANACREAAAAAAAAAEEATNEDEGELP